ncbi:hypothetical protein [Streptomyces sp. JW3]|uniref:hypothetical protein n=1 Tax=Streptomyces sp. JW3 TaxID=3456955 RepID=UPI003FA40FCF
MDWRLILDYVKVLIWPSVTVVLGLTFRKQLAKLSQRVDSVETPVGSLTFATQADAIAQEAESVEHALVAEIQESVSSDDADSGIIESRQMIAKIRRVTSRVSRVEGRFAELSAASAGDPAGAVLGAWRELELNASRAALTRVSRQTGILRVIEERGFLPEHLIRLTHDLMQLRDRVAHAGDVSLTESDAKAYVAAAQTVSDALELAQTPQARYLRYERALQSVLYSLNLPVQKSNVDRGVDFLVGDYDGVVGIEVKFSSRGPYLKHSVEMVAARHQPSMIPVLIVVNAPLGANVAGMQFDPDSTSVCEVIQWRNQEDNNQLIQALSRCGVSY